MKLSLLVVVLLLASCELPGSNRDLRIAASAAEAKSALAGGANVDATDPFGSTPLMYAARNGHADVAALLIARGANVNAKNAPGDTALSWAIKYGHPDIASLLMSHGAIANTNPEAASVPMPTPALDPGKRGGCLGRDVSTCLANLQPIFHVEQDQDIQRQMTRNDAVDINGKPISKKSLLIIGGTLAGSNVIGMVTLQYTREKIVNNADISLWGDPSLARTEGEFNATGLYEGALALLGSECKELNRRNIYSFFYNVVKPRIVRERRDVEINDTNAEINYFQRAYNIPYCGYKFSYSHLFGYNTDDITPDNPHGAGAITTISFKS